MLRTFSPEKIRRLRPGANVHVFILSDPCGWSLSVLPLSHNRSGLGASRMRVGVAAEVMSDIGDINNYPVRLEWESAEVISRRLDSKSIVVSAGTIVFRHDRAVGCISVSLPIGWLVSHFPRLSLVVSVIQGRTLGSCVVTVLV
jgi:hypothetical protein